MIDPLSRSFYEVSGVDFMPSLSGLLKKLSLGEVFRLVLHPEIERLIYDYQDQVLRCCDAFHEATEEFLRHGKVTDEFGRLERIVHRRESEADDLRRKLEVMMYKMNLIPQSRGDVLMLVEALDKMPNHMENVAQLIYIQNLSIPAIYIDRFRELVRENIEAVRLCVKMFQTFCAGCQDVDALVQGIDRLESISDHHMRALIYEFFRNPAMTDLDKQLLRDLCDEISLLSDKAEKFSDRAHVVSVKRIF
jgi:predicted phosphate transport protein (TIGR00153 family)